MKANYISPNIDIIEVDVTCLYAGSPGDYNNTVGGSDYEQGNKGEDNPLFPKDSRTSSFSDLW